MSGTSMDGVDAALVRFDDHTRRATLLATHSIPYPPPLRAGLERLLVEALPLAEFSRLDAAVGETFARAGAALMAALPAGVRVGALACHGQTVWHEPAGEARNSLQIGDPHRLAAVAGVTVIADIRRADLARGGQGAPLAAGFHAWAFGPGPVGILNLGGIANLTVLAGAGTAVTAFDTGPGCTLLDRWIARIRGETHDHDGHWARTGRVDLPLLRSLLTEPWLAEPVPRSTGREHFNLAWLEARAGRRLQNLAPGDVQRTLLAFTVETVAREVEGRLPPAAPVLVCGGGSRNGFLLQELASRLAGRRVSVSDAAGVPAAWMECVAFAWLARERMAGRPGSLASVTGAAAPCLLGSRIDPLGGAG
jgi:anhydro-N-acetylmuramic acid kinase